MRTGLVEEMVGGLKRKHAWLFQKEISTPGDSSALPSDVLDRSVLRLTAVSAFGFAAAVVATILFAATDLLRIGGGFDRPILTIVSIGVMSAIVFFLARSQAIASQTKLTIGLGYLVLASFSMGLFRHWLPYHPDDVIRGPSPVMVLNVLFPVLIPVAPRRMLLAGLLAAATDPLAMLLLAHAGRPMPSVATQLWLFCPGFGGAVLGQIAAHVIYSLGKSVREARELGSYRLVECLGEGGMGEVWRAEHRMLARPAAVKLIKPERLGASDPALANIILGRFEREAQATAALQSHHTVELYDFGVADNGTFYYVMELLHGMNLETLVSRHGPLPPGRIVYLLRQVCHSLRDAHHAGVVHRDVKPANIYVCQKGLDYDYVKVLDFGLVKYHQPTPAEVRLTVEGGVAGTPACMSPEAVLGKRDLDHRADIYSLGCVAYCLATGRDVFAGDTPMEVMIAHVQSPPQPPSELAGDSFPRALEQVILSCLAKSREDRPATIADVDRALAGVEATPSWGNAEAEAWWREHAAHEPGPPAAHEPTAPGELVLADTLPGAAEQGGG